MTTSSVAFQSPAVSANSSASTNSPCWHAQFEEMLPKIQRHAQIVFRGRRGDSRDEAIQEVACHARTASSNGGAERSQ